MCRIYGHFGGKPLSEKTLSAITNSMLHGGPDAQTSLGGANWLLGANRLAIIDTEGGTQPFTLEKKIFCVFNGEIYNHRQLRKYLESRGYSFSDSCDGSIIPALYAEYGRNFIRYLDGMFAIALIDCRNDPMLILANDAVAIKSLYYHWNPLTKTVSFASELPALLLFPGVEKELWNPAIDAYLTMRTICGKQTIYKNIYTLEPASILVASQDQEPSINHYETAVDVPEPSLELASAGAELASLLQKEVEYLLTADVPVCLVTSGGLDSSLLTALAAASQSHVPSFHICYTGNWPDDERLYAREVAAHCGTTHHEIEMSPLELAELLPKMVWHLGQPNTAPHSLSTFALFQAIHQAGFKVAITGEGADEVFGGYDRFALATLGGENWLRTYLDAFASVRQTLRWQLYSEEYRALLLSNASLDETLSHVFLENEANRLQNLLNFDLNKRFPYYILRRVDHLSMAHSVEVRVPFCQKTIVRFASRLPESHRIFQREVKRVLYAAGQGLLPESVLSRKKQPFTLPIQAMMNNGEVLFGMMRDVLSSKSFNERMFFNSTAVAKLIDTHQQNPNSQSAQALWSLMILELWLRMWDKQ